MKNLPVHENAVFATFHLFNPARLAEIDFADSTVNVEDIVEIADVHDKVQISQTFKNCIDHIFLSNASIIDQESLQIFEIYLSACEDIDFVEAVQNVEIFAFGQ